jgi:hypothetical protein
LMLKKQKNTYEHVKKHIINITKAYIYIINAKKV